MKRKRIMMKTSKIKNNDRKRKRNIMKTGETEVKRNIMKKRRETNKFL